MTTALLEDEVIDQDKEWADLCRDSFEDFVREFVGCVPGLAEVQIHWNWHLSVFCHELQEAAEHVFANELRPHDLVVNVSPGTTKSTIFSILFPAWVWTRMPHARFLMASHTDNLVLDLSTKSREVIKSHKYQTYFPEIGLSKVQDAKGHFRNTKGGDRYTCTVGGKTPMGFHAHFIIVDDPIDPEKVLSEVGLLTAEEFMLNYIANRKTDKGVTVTILVMQRLGVGDPTDVVLEHAKKEGAAKIRHVCLPSDLDPLPEGGYDGADVLPREYLRHYLDYNQEAGCHPCGLMDPVRLGRVILVEAKAGRAHFYATQFRQKPYAREGGMFQEHYFENHSVRAAPYDCKRIFYWDRAATPDGGCYTAGVLMARDKDSNFYVEKVIHGQWEPRDRNQRILAQARWARKKFGKYEPTIVIENEGGSSGVEAYQGLARLLAGFKVKKDKVTGKKEVRAEPWSDQCAAGNVFFVDDGSWDFHSYVKEHCAFPGGRYKDQVDASSGGFNLLSGARKSFGLRTYPLGQARGRHKGLRILAVDVQDLEDVVLDERALLVCVLDPEPATPKYGLVELPREGVMQSGEGLPRQPDEVASRNGGVVSGVERPPTHGLSTLVDQVTVRFADLDKADLQAVWEEPLEPWGRRPEDLCMDPSQGKKLWGVLTRRRDPQPQVIVFAGPGSVALSLAYGYVDALGLPRAIISEGGEDESRHDGDPPNRHVFETFKRSKVMVVS